MQTTNTQRQHLKALFSDKNGKAAFDELRKTLNTKKRHNKANFGGK